MLTNPILRPHQLSLGGVVPLSHLFPVCARETSIDSLLNCNCLANAAMHFSKKDRSHTYLRRLRGRLERFKGSLIFLGLPGMLKLEAYDCILHQEFTGSANASFSAATRLRLGQGSTEHHPNFVCSGEGNAFSLFLYSFSLLKL